jgi:hypothetical protein
MTDAYSAAHVAAAMCIHEAMLDARLESSLPAVTAAFDQIGTHGMRQHALRLAPFFMAVHDALPVHTRAGFNYAHTIIPAILATVQWPLDLNGYALPEVQEAAADVVLELDAA